MMFLLVLALAVPAMVLGQCVPSVTTASGTHAPTGQLCSGDLIFEDNFDTCNYDVWEHENTLAGGGNWEFQWYTNNRSNSYCEDGSIFLRPTLTENTLGDNGIQSATLNLHGGAPADACTNPQFWGCERSGSAENVLNPIRSARVRLVKSFNFKYGILEIRARMPTGDWLWPALWLLPKTNSYGTWPASGEIDLMESRGNLNLVQGGVNIGAQQIGNTLHFGPDPNFNRWDTAHSSTNNPDGFNTAFHTYSMVWSETGITFFVDGAETLNVAAGSGFWDRGQFGAIHPGRENPWRTGTNMAPFDQEFYVLMNLAVGGIAYFPDDAENPGGKPWSNAGGFASTDFWNGRNQWLPGWNLEENFSKAASMEVDYVRIWAL